MSLSELLEYGRYCITETWLRDVIGDNQIALENFNLIRRDRLFDKLSDNPWTDELVTSFSSQVTNALNNIFPLKTVKLHHTDKPWITPSIKQLIKDRQKAFYRGDKQQWQLLKCKVQSEIKQRKEMFYKDKIQHLRKDDCRKWHGGML